ncbi:MAG: hypothetical protein IJF52_07030 [Clostridia bacterium]|nr:hypothetical protein [Clostridia bacterium]
MKTKTFYVFLFAVMALCILLTIAHVIYAVYAYQHCSIIQFIAKELW